MTALVFPTLAGQGFATVRRPIWRTLAQSSVSGKEQRIEYMSFPLYEWEVNMNVLRTYAATDELAQLQGFFNTMFGMGDTFLFTDPNDNAITAQTIGAGNGVQLAFQLTRTYGTYNEPVQSVNTAQIYVNGVLQTVGANYTIGSTGIVTFSVPPPAGQSVTWTGTYYFAVRFTTDTIDFVQEVINIWSCAKLSFQLVKQ